MLLYLAYIWPEACLSLLCQVNVISAQTSVLNRSVPENQSIELAYRVTTCLHINISFVTRQHAICERGKKCALKTLNLLATRLSLWKSRFRCFMERFWDLFSQRLHVKTLHSGRGRYGSSLDANIPLVAVKILSAILLTSWTAQNRKQQLPNLGHL